MSDEKPTGPSTGSSTSSSGREGSKASAASERGGGGGRDGGGERREGEGRGRRRRGRRRPKADGGQPGAPREGGDQTQRAEGEGRSRRRRGGRGRGRSRGEGQRGDDQRGDGQRDGQRSDDQKDSQRDGQRDQRGGEGQRASTGEGGEAPRKRRRRRRRRPDGEGRPEPTDERRRDASAEGEPAKDLVPEVSEEAKEPVQEGPLSELDDGWDLDESELSTPTPTEQPSRDSADGGLPFSDVALRQAAAADKAGPVEPDDDLELGEPGVALTDDAQLLDQQLCRVIQVQVSTAPQIELDAGDLEVAKGDQLIVETERGLTLGVVLGGPERRMVAKRPPRVVRKIGDADPRLDRAAQREREAYEYCRDRIRSRNMPMKLIRTEFLQSGNKALFYFAAENRVDFRELVKDLARRLHARIEMRQIGVRDESRMSAGLGPCGRELCCSSWILDFQPVSIRMAKDQNLVLNPTKVSGMCGRLKCCLAYEQALYKEARKSLPKVGHRVTTPKGNGRVHEIDIPRRIARVLLTDGSIETFKADEVQRQT